MSIILSISKRPSVSHSVNQGSVVCVLFLKLSSVVDYYSPTATTPAATRWLVSPPQDVGFASVNYTQILGRRYFN